MGRGHSSVRYCIHCMQRPNAYEPPRIQKPTIATNEIVVRTFDSGLAINQYHSPPRKRLSAKILRAATDHFSALRSPNGILHWLPIPLDHP